jgi:hypothetical protein
VPAEKTEEDRPEIRFDILSAPTLPQEIRDIIYDLIFADAYFDPFAPYPRGPDGWDYDCHYVSPRDMPGANDNGTNKWNEHHETDITIYHRGNMPGALRVSRAYRAAMLPAFMSRARWVFADPCDTTLLCFKMSTIPRLWLRHGRRVLITQDFQGAISEKCMPNLREVHFHMCFSRVNGEEGRLEFQVDVDSFAQPSRVMEEYDDVVGRYSSQKFGLAMHALERTQMFRAHMLQLMQAVTPPPFNVSADVHVTFYDNHQMMITNDVSTVLVLDVPDTDGEQVWVLDISHNRHREIQGSDMEFYRAQDCRKQFA